MSVTEEHTLAAHTCAAVQREVELLLDEQLSFPLRNDARMHALHLILQQHSAVCGNIGLQSPARERATLQHALSRCRAAVASQLRSAVRLTDGAGRIRAAVYSCAVHFERGSIRVWT